MKITDLTHIIDADMPVFPGTRPPVFEPACTIAKHGFNEAQITIFSHTGTHIDAPGHILPDEPYLDGLDIQHFIGKALILDVSHEKPGRIEMESLRRYEEKIPNADFIILKTGWSQYWGEKKYFEAFPSLSEEAARWLARFHLKGVGIDAISIDDIESTAYEVHKILLACKMIIVENLCNLDSISQEYFTLSVLPLKIRQGDGSPVRAVAIEDLSE